MYDFDTLLQRQNTNCTKWDALIREYGRDNLMPFWVADADFALLPEISKAIRTRAGETDSLGYTFAGESYFDSVIHWNHVRHDLTLTRENIIPAPGVVTALAVAIMALTGQGDRLLINPPVYSPFAEVVKGLKRELIQSPLIYRGGRYLIDFADLEEKLSGNIRMYILCSPHNPVGRVWTADELNRVAALCRKYHVILVSDEIHYDIVYPEHRHIPILNIEPDAIMLTAPSKTFNIAGLKSSVILVKNADYHEKVQKQIDVLHLYLNLFAYRVTETAYRNGAKWVDELIAYLKKNAQYTLDYLTANSKIKTYMPESTYLMWLDFSAYGLSSEAIGKKLVEKAHLALSPGLEYGENCGQWMRFNIAVPRYYLQKGLEQMTGAFGA